MIFTEDFDDQLRSLGREFLIADIQYVNSLTSWTKKNNASLSEPAQPMKLITGANNQLVMIVQKEISDEAVEGIINALSVRWAVSDVVTDINKRLNSPEKKLAWYFLKEYARTKEDLVGDDLLEDRWTINKMEKLGFFRK